jgi:hypothetical protein
MHNMNRTQYMTTMNQFNRLSIEERRLLPFAPLGQSIYNGLGYILPSKTHWNDDTICLLKQWASNNNVIWDGPVIVFPNDETFIMCKMVFS